MAIKCFVPDCSESVIGQCSGLENEPCGHFYCSKHSRGKLCDECAAVQDEKNLFQKYLDAAQWVNERIGCGWRILIILLLITCILLAIFTQNVAAIVVLMVIFLTITIVAVELRKKKRLQKVCEELEDFDIFFKVYKKYADKAALRSALAGTLDFVAYTLSPEVSTASDIRRIRNRLDKM